MLLLLLYSGALKNSIGNGNGICFTSQRTPEPLLMGDSASLQHSSTELTACEHLAQASVLNLVWTVFLDYSECASICVCCHLFISLFMDTMTTILKSIQYTQSEKLPQYLLNSWPKMCEDNIPRAGSPWLPGTKRHCPRHWSTGAMLSRGRWMTIRLPSAQYLGKAMPVSCRV